MAQAPYGLQRMEASLPQLAHDDGPTLSSWCLKLPAAPAATPCLEVCLSGSATRRRARPAGGGTIKGPGARWPAWQSVGVANAGSHRPKQPARFDASLTQRWPGRQPLLKPPGRAGSHC
eukprot:354423-Chlamydomonas_euryale.AAC.3